MWNDLEGEQQYFSGQASGGRLAAPIWAQFMLVATAGLPVEDFPPPPAAASVSRVWGAGAGTVGGG